MVTKVENKNTNTSIPKTSVQKDTSENKSEKSIFFGLGTKLALSSAAIFNLSGLTTICSHFVNPKIAQKMKVGGLTGMAVSGGVFLANLLYIIHKYKQISKLDEPKMCPDKQGEYSDKNVVILDDFQNKSPLMLGLPHGKLVRKYITENLPGVNIEERNISFNMFDNNDVVTELRKVLKEIEDGKKYDAINLSLSAGNPIWLSNLKVNVDGKEIKITKENMHKYRHLLSEAYDNFQNTNQFNFSAIMRYGYGKDFNKILKEISDKGVKIFLAHNNYIKYIMWSSDFVDCDNDYEDCNNPNIITVSANDSKWREFPLSDEKECSSYEYKKIGNKIDITGDNIPDIIDENNNLKFLHYLGISTLKGNSFATPTALAKYLKEQNDKNK